MKKALFIDDKQELRLVEVDDTVKDSEQLRVLPGLWDAANMLYRSWDDPDDRSEVVEKDGDVYTIECVDGTNSGRIYTMCAEELAERLHRYEGQHFYTVFICGGENDGEEVAIFDDLNSATKFAQFARAAEGDATLAISDLFDSAAGVEW